ncbi:MAG: alanine racemase [Nitriliruptoraceae bacterium]
MSNPPAEVGPPKGFPVDSPDDLGAIGGRGWSLFSGGFGMPIAAIIEPIARRNSRTMADYCARHGLEMAPHGKTTMSPQLFEIQLEDGAWGITAATVWQARTMIALGVPRVIIANEVTSVPDMRELADLIKQGAQVICYVDSLEGVDLLDHTLRDEMVRERLGVLIEYGVTGLRTGVRTVAEGVEVATAARDAAHLAVVGVSCFEGVITARDGRSAHDLVKEFLAEFHQMAVKLDEAGLFGGDEIIVTAGGSAYFDHVAAEFAKIELSKPIRRILRSGNYLTHADGGYSTTSPMGDNPRVDEDEGRLVAAMEVWGVVLSRPEPTRALVNIGKRDVSPDSAAPILRYARKPDGTPVATKAEPLKMDDQHLYLDLEPDDPLAVGDYVAVGVRHGCTTYNNWRVIPMVDEDYKVLRVARTYF